VEAGRDILITVESVGHRRFCVWEVHSVKQMSGVRFRFVENGSVARKERAGSCCSVPRKATCGPIGFRM